MSQAASQCKSAIGARGAKRFSVNHLVITRLDAHVAWIGLLMLSVFLWTKISFSTQGTGWLYLPAFAVNVAIVTTLRLRSGVRLSLGLSAPWVVLFGAWFLTRLLLDAESIADVLGYTIGYGEGIFFAYGLGVSTRVLLDAVGRSPSAPFRWVFAMLLFAFNAWSAMRVEETALSAGSLHREYAFFDNDTYQLSGALAGVLAIVTASLLVRSSDEPARGMARIAKWALLLNAAATFAMMARLSQLLGSNAGLAFIVPIAVLSIATAWVGVRPPTMNALARGTQCLRSFLRALASVCATAVLLAAACAGAIVFAVANGVIDITRYRAFGFEESSLYNPSVDSRLRILAENFPKHLVHSPFFGHFFVDRITTGDGTYVHGLVAVLPHLGIVGAILFITMLVGIGAQLRSQWRASRRGSREARFAMLAILLTAWVVGYMLLTTFFTNVILWMSLGLFAPALRLREPPSEMSDIGLAHSGPSKF